MQAESSGCGDPVATPISWLESAIILRDLQVLYLLSLESSNSAIYEVSYEVFRTCRHIVSRFIPVKGLVGSWLTPVVH